MKKLVLGVVALGVALSSAYGVCENERNTYASCLKAVADYEEYGYEILYGGYRRCVDGGLQNAKLRLEACLVKNGHY